MSNNLRKCLKTLTLYCNTNEKKFKNSLLQEMAKNEAYYKAIREIVYNIKNKKINLDKSDKKKLIKFVKILLIQVIAIIEHNGYN